MNGDEQRDRLELSPEEMRALGYRVVDLIVERFATLPEQPVAARGARADLEARLREPLPEAAAPPEQVLAQVERDVLPWVMPLPHPRFFGFVASPSNFVSAMADALASGINVFAGSWISGSGAAQVELVTIDWLRQLCGLPEAAGGLFVSGGSMANLTALAVARHARLGDRFQEAAVYFSDQTHSSIERALRVLGFTPPQLCPLPSSEDGRLSLAVLRRAVEATRAAGGTPFCVVANAGTVNTGAVDPLPELADFCQAEGMWLHADGAYGAAAVLCDAGRAALAGLERVDSLSLDPHKWLFQPYEIGCVLLRDAAQLRAAFRVTPDYLKDTDRATEEVNFFDYGIQLTRSFRALKLWMSLKVFGLPAFRRAVARGIALAEHAEAVLRRSPRWEVVTPAQLGIVTFRYVPPPERAGAADAVNDALVEAMIADGFAFLTSTRLHGRTALRLCTINPRTTEADLEATVARLEELAQGLL